MLSVFSTKLVSKIADGYLRTKTSRNMSFSLMDIQDYIQEDNASQWGRFAVNQYKSNGNGNGNNIDVFDLKTVDTDNDWDVHNDLNNLKNVRTINNNNNENANFSSN